MSLICVGVNHKHASIDIREKFSLTKENQRNALKEFLKLDGVDECIILSTCNRTEIYLYASDLSLNNDVIEMFLCSFQEVNINNMKEYFYTFKGIEVVRHLFRVASGLDSMVLGEDEILRQVKEAHNLAHEEHSISSVLNTAFRLAITASKKIKTNTGLSKNSVSIGSVAIKLLCDYYGESLKSKTALIIGTGKMGITTMKNLIATGIAKIYISNRTKCKAQDLSKMYQSVYNIDLDMKYKIINECDIVISATSSPHLIITWDKLKAQVNDLRERIFIDLAVPRDIDYRVKEIPFAKYYNIDDLKSKSEESLEKRLLEFSKAEEIIEEYVVEFEKWFGFRNIIPLATEVERFLETIKCDKLEQIILRLKLSNQQDIDLIDKMMTSLTKEVMNKFIYSIKDYTDDPNNKNYVKGLSKIFEVEL